MDHWTGNAILGGLTYEGVWVAGTERAERRARRSLRRAPAGAGA